MEHFYTLQGEGMFTGHAAYFIRLGGCDVGCVWCDVKDSWDSGKHPLMTTAQIVAAASSHPGRIAVITGGEPCMHDLAPLCDALQDAGFRTHIETSGSSPLSGRLDWITLSPKKFKAPLEECLAAAHEL
ncbi:MAG: radical SAM protein, partial [Sphingobacteriales bacterium]